MSSPDVLSAERKRMAANFRSLINDLKRRPEDAAGDLQITVQEVTEILSGRREISAEIIEKALQAWPLGPRDFFLLRDDCPRGLKITRAEESERSARLMSRAGSDYYEYRDTAMSSVAAFRPEWIQELCVVEDNDPENPAVQWNNGHFLHQFTYFIGPVNFYYRDRDGTKKVAVMSTGDSMYISPFVPHTFTTRKNQFGDLGLILALTYNNKLGGEAQQELALFGEEQAKRLVLNFDSGVAATGSLVRFHREALSMPVEVFAGILGEDVNSIKGLEDGERAVSTKILEKISCALKIPLRELLSGSQGEDPVQIQTHAKSRTWDVNCAGGEPEYKIVELCSAKKLPFSKALEITVNPIEQDSDTWLEVGLHQYVYNLGHGPVRLRWQFGTDRYEEYIQSGDSFYMKPGIRHSYKSTGATLLALRIGGRVGGDVLQEIADIGESQLQRVLSESMQWFDPEGRQDVSD